MLKPAIISSGLFYLNMHFYLMASILLNVKSIKLFLKKDFKMFKKAILPLALVLASGAANAGLVTNDTDILTGDDHAQLSEWLGADFDLTRIFAKGVDGDTGKEWHSVVDGKGATFTVMELIDNDTNERTVIGGYSDISWESNGSLGVSGNAFLFNLTDGAYYGRNDRHLDLYATRNTASYGATFGLLRDLYVSYDLTTGYANIGAGYGDRTQYGKASYREEFAGSYDNWTIGSYETFTLSESTADFSASSVANVPASFLLGGLGLLGLVGARRKNKA